MPLAIWSAASATTSAWFADRSDSRRLFSAAISSLSISRRTSAGGGSSDPALPGVSSVGTSPERNENSRLRWRGGSCRDRRIAWGSIAVIPGSTGSALPELTSAAPHDGHFSMAADGRTAEHHGQMGVTGSDMHAL